MWPQLLMMILFLVGALFFLFLFINDIIQVAVNGILLYLIGLRTYVELTKYKRFEAYVWGFAVALVAVTLIGSLAPLWKLTTFVVVMFAVAQGLRFMRK
ncbi:hypothetical protein HY490_02665 [Candidatus Woesearchaeota archaeon]|nr:hypothetical protein [Candidatus Woesearchaeota archaeon]